MDNKITYEKKFFIDDAVIRIDCVGINNSSYSNSVIERIIDKEINTFFGFENLESIDIIKGVRDILKRLDAVNFMIEDLSSDLYRVFYCTDEVIYDYYSSIKRGNIKVDSKFDLYNGYSINSKNSLDDEESVFNFYDIVQKEISFIKDGIIDYNNNEENNKLDESGALINEKVR